jgi:phosphatidate phosphatase PAH1
MRTCAFLLSLVLCAGCALTQHEVRPAPPERNQAVVFDIDGTLTTRVHAIRSTRSGAVAAVQAYADAGYLVIYLSARHPLFQWHIPIWLERHGFPQGPIHVTESREHRRDHASFKHGVLDDYRSSGWELIAGYGDSSTDFSAYAHAGIERGRVFALRREGAQACEPGTWAGCYAGWPEQMELIGDLIDARH